MRIRRLLPVCALFISSSVIAAGGESDPIVTQLKFDQFERRSTEGDDFNAIEGEAWVGKDIDKLRFKFEAEFTDDETESLETQLVYSHAITPFWDVQAGYRRDIYPKPENDWLVFGFIGLAPYLFEIDAAIFIGESGQYGARLEAEYELMLTQKWVLVPEIEINAYAEDDEAAGIGSGFSDLELGLRLNYFINRQFAPYIGINWEKKFGDTADFSRDEGEDTNDVQYVIGIHGWF